MRSSPSAPDVTLESFLLQKRSAIVRKWLDVVLETYPAETAKFLKGQKNRFANPVGSIVSQGIEDLFQELLQTQAIDPERVAPFLDRIIRIRAVQDFSPSQAIAFVFLLKKVIREELGFAIRENQLSEELSALESRIDRLALLSFDVYMQCREKVYELRTTEWKNRLFRLLQKADLLCEIEEQKSDLKDANIDSLNEAR